MSTKFGVCKKNLTLKEDELTEENISENEFIEVALRSQNIWWTNDLSEFFFLSGKSLSLI